LDAILELNQLGFRYDRIADWVVADFSLKIGAGEFVAIVGGSGVGKSTILRMAAGLIAPEQGKVQINSVREPGRRRRAMVFQDGRLMPWRTVAANVALGLEGLKLEPEEAKDRISDVLDLTGLSELGERWPHQLSGGQVQRVGIARALAVQPDVLLMDEPFSAVDAITRRHLQGELVRIWRTSGKAVAFVTHDIEEAIFLADRIVVLGGAPARTTEEFRIEAERESRRESPELHLLVRKIAARLENG
jgi:NitT/TauT family transport system ATP-binding protein